MKQGRTAIRALIFDFDGVLSNDRYWRTSRMPFFASLQEAVFSKQNSFVTEWMRGRISSESVCEDLAAKLALHYDDVWSGLVESCQKFTLAEGIRDCLKALRTEYRIGLVTTNMDCFSRFVVPALGIADQFDAVLNSSDVGMLKDDENGAIYELLAARLGIPTTAMMLFDDSRTVGDIFATHGGRHILVEGGPLQRTDFATIGAIVRDDVRLDRIACGRPVQSYHPSKSLKRGLAN